MKIEGICKICTNNITIHIPDDYIDNYYSFSRGEILVQDALPCLSAADREFLISRCCDSCFDKLFPPE